MTLPRNVRPAATGRPDTRSGPPQTSEFVPAARRQLLHFCWQTGRVPCPQNTTLFVGGVPDQIEVPQIPEPGGNLVGGFTETDRNVRRGGRTVTQRIQYPMHFGVRFRCSHHPVACP